MCVCDKFGAKRSGKKTFESAKSNCNTLTQDYAMMTLSTSSRFTRNLHHLDTLYSISQVQDGNVNNLENALEVRSERYPNNVLLYDLHVLPADDPIRSSNSMFKHAFKNKIESEKLKGTACIVVKADPKDVEIVEVMKSFDFRRTFDCKEFVLRSLPLEIDSAWE